MSQSEGREVVALSRRGRLRERDKKGSSQQTKKKQKDKKCTRCSVMPRVHERKGVAS